MFEETTDMIGRYVFNILIGECSENGKCLSVVIKTIHLDRINITIFK